MSRSGYSEDCEHLQLWRAAVDRSLRGTRGQAFLGKLRDALDAMPNKRLISGELANDAGEVCALGSVDPGARLDPYDRHAVAGHFHIAPAMAAEIAFVNDDDFGYGAETPEHRWSRMRAWVEWQLTLPPSNTALARAEGRQP